MKAKFLMIPAVVGLFMVTSCNKKATEQTLKSINDFETNWAALGQTAATWSADLKTYVDKSTECATKTEAMVNTAPEAVKAQCTEMATACNNDKTAFEGMWNEFTAFQPTWDADTKAFTEWKEKVTKGELNDEQAVAGLQEFQSKLDATKAKIDGWNTAFTTSKATCDANINKCMEAEKMAAEEAAKKDTKKDGGKKKA